MKMSSIQEKVKAVLALIASFVLGRPPQLHSSSPPSPSVVDAERPPSLPPPPPTSPSFNLELELLDLLTAQPRQQWQNAILTFCFTFALGISLQVSPTDESKELPSSFVLLSFAVLLTFTLLLVAFFISRKHARASIVLEKVALFLAACLAITIPFPLNLKFASWILLFFTLFVIMICTFLYGNIPQ